MVLRVRFLAISNPSRTYTSPGNFSKMQIPWPCPDLQHQNLTMWSWRSMPADSWGNWRGITGLTHSLEKDFETQSGTSKKWHQDQLGTGAEGTRRGRWPSAPQKLMNLTVFLQLTFAILSYFDFQVKIHLKGLLSLITASLIRVAYANTSCLKSLCNNVGTDTNKWTQPVMISSHIYSITESLTLSIFHLWDLLVPAPHYYIPCD